MLSLASGGAQNLTIRKKSAVTHFLKLAEKYQNTHSIIWEGIGLSPLVQSKWKDIVRIFHERIKHAIQYSQQLGMARRLPAEQVAWVLLSAVEHNLWQIALGESSQSVEEIAETIVEVYSSDCIESKKKSRK